MVSYNDFPENDHQLILYLIFLERPVVINRTSALSARLTSLVT